MSKANNVDVDPEWVERHLQTVMQEHLNKLIENAFLYPTPVVGESAKAIEQRYLQDHTAKLMEEREAQAREAIKNNASYIVVDRYPKDT